MADGDGTSSRNFRSAYYEKLGFCGNEEKDILDLLISSSQLDSERLKDLCEKFDLDRRSIDAWKILLGVDCGKKNPFDDYANVKRIRTEHFQSLKHHLEILLRHNIILRDKSALEKYIQSNPGRQITLMYLLEAGQLESSDIDNQLNNDHCQKLSAMSTFFVSVSSDLQEAFFLFRNFIRKLAENGKTSETSQTNNNPNND